MTQVLVAVGRNHQGLDLGATAQGSSPSARLAHRAFVVKFESKNFYIATKMCQPDRRPGCEVAFIADSTGQGHPLSRGGEDARPTWRETHFVRPDTCAN